MKSCGMNSNKEQNNATPQDVIALGLNFEMKAINHSCIYVSPPNDEISGERSESAVLICCAFIVSTFSQNVRLCHLRGIEDVV